MDILVGTLLLASMYALVAFAWVLMFKTTGILNLATGAHLAIGAYLFDTFATRWELPWAITIAGWLVSGLAIAWVTQMGLFRRLAGQPEFVLVIATLGLASLLKGVQSLTWGTDSRLIREPFRDEFYFLPGDAVISAYGIATIGVAVVVFVASGIFFSRTKIGVEMRVTAEHAILAAQSGIRVDRIYIIGWWIAFSIASLAGILYAYNTALSPNMGDALGLRGIAPALVGGLDSIRGVIPGALIVAFAEVVGVRLLGGQMQDVTAWIVILAVLLIKPNGLFGSASVNRV
ncbi:branched-chain amino acid ABC transporter permease [Pseudoruegeria sp. HB172150]|uniref:branched-chain amino acid ABC transporter permease n=1 Tax=Pseudoruegeria sp. HB172150 TaxID=2721164 RepID=UPI0015569B09|nr:branched-chain amino acid ABC transporter permease [Pseudoruegeria sp. HB172150]